jgi:CheY-like chemotaxis protein
VAAAVSRQGGRAVLHVTDDGIGIAPGQLESIFELFAQGPTTLARVPGGLGIGLTLVRALVKMLGGTVEATSPGLDKGSDFRVELPLAAAAAQVARSPPPVALVPPARRRVLVVEDNGDIREVLAEVLDTLGYVVDVANDGPEGLSRLLADRPDVALVDIGLPGFDGYELARRARQSRGPSPLLIAMTGYGQAEDRERAAEAGFDEHVTKPVTVDTIKALLARHGGGERHVRQQTNR